MREIRISDKSTKNPSTSSAASAAASDGFSVRSLENLSQEERAPGEKVKVRFDKFVQLVATHRFDDILEENASEEIIMNSNLLMDLANAHEDAPSEKKTPTIFIGGLILGIGLAYILFKFFL